MRGLSEVLIRRSRGDGPGDAAVRGSGRRRREAVLAALAVAAADGAGARGACPHADLASCSCAWGSNRTPCLG